MITCKNLSVGYNKKSIIENLNFEIYKGDYLSIIGMNGAGKSTLMKTILGLSKPLSGSVVFNEGLRQTDIGYLSQQTSIQEDFPASVKEIVLSGCQAQKGYRPFYNREEKKLADYNMERMEILNLSSKCYRDLSGGQKQRVLIARALCATKKILMMDEPASSLDPNVTAKLYQVTSELSRQGITIVMITHDIERAIQDSKHILYIGGKNFWGTTEEYTKRSESFGGHF